MKKIKLLIIAGLVFSFVACEQKSTTVEETTESEPDVVVVEKDAEPAPEVSSPPPPVIVEEKEDDNNTRVKWGKGGIKVESEKSDVVIDKDSTSFEIKRD